MASFNVCTYTRDADTADTTREMQKHKSKEQCTEQMNKGGKERNTIGIATVENKCLLTPFSSVRHMTGDRVWTLIYNPAHSASPPAIHVPTPPLQRQRDGVAMATMATAEANVSDDQSFLGLCLVHTYHFVKNVMVKCFFFR